MRTNKRRMVMVTHVTHIREKRKVCQILRKDRYNFADLSIHDRPINAHLKEIRYEIVNQIQVAPGKVRWRIFMNIVTSI
jgi:hypothetical protein